MSEGEEGINNVFGLLFDIFFWLCIKEQEVKSREWYYNFIKYVEEGIYFVKCDLLIFFEGFILEE